MQEKNLEKIHPKFARERVCKYCTGHFLAKTEKDFPDLCPMCTRDGRLAKPDNLDDVLFKEVNISDLQRQVTELKEMLEMALKDKEGDDKTVTVKVYKPKSCVQCDKEFQPASGAQKICSECREKLTE